MAPELVKDFVLLGKSVPEWMQTTGGMQSVCTAGFSADRKSLIRICPMNPKGTPKRWTEHMVFLEKTYSTDSRPESYNLASNNLDFPRISLEVGKFKAKSLRDTLAPYYVNSIQEANERRISLALINPREVKFELRENFTEYDELGNEITWRQSNLSSPLRAKERFKYQPRVSFMDDGGKHDIQVRDWGVYELMRNYAADIASLPTHADREEWVGRPLYMDGTETFFIGNMLNHRNNWLVISVLKGLR